MGNTGKKSSGKWTPAMLALWLPCEGQMDFLLGSSGTGAPESNVLFKSGRSQRNVLP